MVHTVTVSCGVRNVLSRSYNITSNPSKWYNINWKCYFAFYVPLWTPSWSIEISDSSKNICLNTVNSSRKLTSSNLYQYQIINFDHDLAINSSYINRSRISTAKLSKLFHPFTVQKKMLSDRKDDDQKDIQNMRKPYRSSKDIFDLSQLVSRNPMKQFQAWFQEASNHPQIIETNAIALATATLSGRPSVRMLLLKGITSEGFYFYTNFESRKAKEIEENPFCSFSVHWEPLNRSIRVDGKVNKISEEESEKYFHQRPRDSQLGALVSLQSTVIPSREHLMNKYVEIQKKYENVELIPKPKYWYDFNYSFVTVDLLLLLLLHHHHCHFYYHHHHHHLMSIFHATKG
ncbi:pyridoxine-5' phosphate oxidase isoform X2 [Octopus vulgaris]|uniref:Pyridoxine-5'-phosphate oxidase n=1 Tax=Octopus vulgaris TaxID=6645 RepID=A0AA36AFW3_OCTVU|nr:pyridoxine-5' phosphate oxidase isoform X2 [Octopus vulgaris]